MANNNGHGGPRKGAGRKPISEEMKSRDLAQKAIIKKYGSLENGFINLLESNDPALKKFVFEHAAGKPTDKIDMTSRVEETRIVDVDEDGNETEDGDLDEDGGPICDPSGNDEFNEDETDD